MSLFSFFRNFDILNRFYSVMIENHLRASRGYCFSFVLIKFFQWHSFCIYLGKYQKGKETSTIIDLWYPATYFIPAYLVNIIEAYLLSLSQHQIGWSKKNQISLLRAA